MGLPLRITFEGRDYTYKVLTKSINKLSTLIRIEMEGKEFELVPTGKGEWYAADTTISDKPDLLKAIARNLALRYRL
ncbi:hypothetical protein ACSBL2_09100 [Pedobacter sp. AW31-3R]|uniref:hypothetical protein n=1 Tax=Pedobacter sp. AW31-3R TaxID=3445781 RepID=UPI003FA05171